MAYLSDKSRLKLVSIPLKVKGTFIPATLLELLDEDPVRIEEALTHRLESEAPLLTQAPIVLEVSQLPEGAPLAPLQQVCKKLSLHLMGIRGGSEHHQNEARRLGLVSLGDTRPKPAANDDRQYRAKVHVGTVRGGQQLVHESGDLVIIGSVNAGSEVLASGNIHIYGALRGRALAGIGGDASVRIFCQALHAELVSIAGRYRPSDAIAEDILGHACQVWLEDDRLRLDPLGV